MSTSQRLIVDCNSAALRECFRAAEHEAVLSFNDDIGAEAFDIWFHHEGKRLLAEWCERDEYFRAALRGY